MDIELTNHDGSKNSITFGSTVPIEEWVKYLVVILAHPHRFIALVSEAEQARSEKGFPFRAYKAVSYISSIGINQQGQPASQAMVIPYELLSVIPYVSITGAAGVIPMMHFAENDKFRDFIVKNYLTVVDPPMVHVSKQ